PPDLAPILALHPAQLSVKALTTLGYRYDQILALVADERLPDPYHQELVAALGLDKIEAYRMRRSLDRFVEAIELLIHTLERLQLPKPVPKPTLRGTTPRKADTTP
ncbi:MAG TPA: hypothetical protein VFO16_14125, partial [Pseudonocardiaceae bacterium]|nr:hypothetical protein [Pseudonocardiaceae bacterium]